MNENNKKQFAQALHNSGLGFQADEILRDLGEVAKTFKEQFMEKSGWTEEKFEIAKEIFTASGRTIINGANTGNSRCLAQVQKRVGDNSKKITISELAEFANDAPEGYESCCDYLDNE